VDDERVSFTFAANQNVARMQLEQHAAWLESVVQRLAGRRLPVVAVQSEAVIVPAAGAGTAAGRPAQPEPAAGGGPVRDAKAEALAFPAVQDLLDVFPGDIRDVEEM
jgi:hypothetical protein